MFVSGSHHVVFMVCGLCFYFCVRLSYPINLNYMGDFTSNWAVYSEMWLPVEWRLWTLTFLDSHWHWNIFIYEISLDNRHYFWVEYPANRKRVSVSMHKYVTRIWIIQKKDVWHPGDNPPSCFAYEVLLVDWPCSIHVNLIFGSDFIFWWVFTLVFICLSF